MPNMNSIKLLKLLFLFIALGCQPSTKDRQVITIPNSSIQVILENNTLIYYDGIDVAKYNWHLEDTEIEQLTLNNVLCEATNICEIELVKELLKRGANPNCKCEEVDDIITNVSFCDEKAVELAKLLIQSGANVNGADEENTSVLSYAIGMDNFEFTRFLLNNGADINQKDSNERMGCLPIHSVESVAMLELLIQKKLEVDTRCDNGRTLLHFAARDNYVDLVRYILDNKLIDIDIKDSNGETALDYAKSADNKEILGMFQ